MFISVVCKCDFIIALKDLQICSADFKHIFQLTTFIFDIGKHSILKFIKQRDLHRDDLKTIVSVQNFRFAEYRNRNRIIRINTDIVLNISLHLPNFQTIDFDFYVWIHCESFKIFRRNKYHDSLTVLLTCLSNWNRIFTFFIGVKCPWYFYLSLIITN